jgi:hypothetical protein
LKYIGLDLDLKQSLKGKTPTNISELQHMKYICEEIIFVMEYEKLHTNENPLRCTTHDEKGLVLTIVLFYFIQKKNNKSKVINFFGRTIF